jgi:hypothetical protein
MKTITNRVIAPMGKLIRNAKEIVQGWHAAERLNTYPTAK